MTEIQRLVDQLNRAYYREAWHGPTVTEVLEGITSAQAAAHPIGQAHSIWEIVLHITAWKLAVRRRLLGEIVELSAEQDWPPVTITSASAWTAALENLKKAHDELVSTVQSLTESQLLEIPAGRKTNKYFQLTGVLQHDAYHAGQIVMLKKMV